MKLSGTILECLSLVKGNSSDAVVFYDHKYYSINGSEIQNIYNNQEIAYSSIQLLGGMWVSEKNSATTKFVDLFDTDNKYPLIQNTTASIDVSNHVIVASTNGIRKRKLLLINLITGSTTEKEFSKGLKFSSDNDFIFTRSEYDKLIECYNYQLEKIWEYTKLEGSAYLDFELKPQLYNCLLIINHAYDIIALNKQTGEEVWKYTFEDIPTSNILMDEKIYAVCSAQLYIINPDNGELLSKADTGYQPYWSDGEHINSIGVFPVGDYLYGVAQLESTGKTIKLFDNQCNLLYQTSPGSYGLNQNASLLPVIKGNKIYQPVKSAYSLSGSGLMVLELTDDDAQAGINVAPRPPHTIIANPSLNETHKLQIFLDVDNLDDALRYGELLTEELHYATGYITIYDMRENALDIKHNGEIELVIDNAEFTEETEETEETEDSLNRLTHKLKESLECGMKTAGDKKTAIKFSLLIQAKTEWDQCGEMLDWPAIRQQETPLL